ncbi:MAG: hypothetical protein QM718_08120 [Steroidobacteraceae bacterium]
MSHCNRGAFAALVVIAGFVSAAAVQAASSATNGAERVAAFARLPDWSGVWLVEGSTASFDPGGKPPPYNAEWAAKYARLRASARPADDTMVKQCMAGVPRLAATAAPFFIMVTPEETLIHYSRREIRHIWTDGRDHPPADEMWPFTWADSIGHWEGQVLVVDTISANGNLWIDPSGAQLSNKARITERISMPDAGHLRSEMIIEDPTALTRPWKVTRTYRRTADADIPEQQCNWRAGGCRGGRLSRARLPWQGGRASPRCSAQPAVHQMTR